MTVASGRSQVRRFRSLAVAICAALAVGAPSVTAQTLAGRFVAPNQQGGTIVLILRQDAQGQLTGSLTAGDVSFQIEGMVDEEGVGIGAMSGEQAAVFFQAELDGGRVVLTLIEPGQDNMPDFIYGEGRSTTGYVAHVYQGQITEVRVNDRHYGKSICH